MLGGVASLAVYAASGKPAEGAPGQLPAEFAAAGTKPVGIVLLHPHCPCSVATLEQLQAIDAQCTGPVDWQVLFFVPPGETADWAQGRLWELAQTLPGARLGIDPGGLASAQLGAELSGTVLAYGPQGRLLFQGGVTAGRGHAGSNPGAQQLLQALRGGAASPTNHWSFGCPIRSLQ